MIGYASDNTANDGDFVCNGRSLRKVVAEDVAILRFDDSKRTAVLDRSLRLRIKRFLLRHSAPQVQLDDAQRLRCQLLSPRRRERVIGIGFQSQHVSQRQTQTTDNTRLNRLSS